MPPLTNGARGLERFIWLKYNISSFQKNLLCVKSQIVQGNAKTVLNGKFEPKVDFGSVIMFNTSLCPRVVGRRLHHLLFKDNASSVS